MRMWARQIASLPLVAATILLGAPATAGAVILSPSSHDFGGHQVGATSPPMTFNLSVACLSFNPITFTCSSAEVINTAITASDPFVVVSETCPATLTTSGLFALCGIEVAFRPTSEGPATGTLTSGTVGVLPGPTAQLRGTGLPAPGGPGGGPLQAAQASNSFSFGNVELNKENGTATLTVDVPGAGEVALGGRGLVKQRPAARASKVANAAGRVKLKVKAKGRKKVNLNEKGKVKVKAKVTFTPTGGLPATQRKKITLKKAL